MKLEELASKYCFHDSLLESVDYNEQEKTASFEVDFCNWAQDGYSDDMPETTMIRLCFKGVEFINNHCVYIESSGISDCRIINSGNGIALEFVVLRDYPSGDGGVDLIQIAADSVEFVMGN